MKLLKKKQRWIHAVAVVGQVAGVGIAWRYLPPYLLHNLGIQILVAVFIVSDVAHFFLHDR